MVVGNHTIFKMCVKENIYHPEAVKTGNITFSAFILLLIILEFKKPHNEIKPT